MPDMPLLTALPAQAEPEPVIQRARRPPVAPRLEMPAVQRTEVQEMSAAPRLTLGQARRLGLGSPINRVASHPPVQLSSDQPLSMPLAPTPAAGSQQTTSETAPVNQPPLGNRTEGPEASDPPVLEPHLTVSRLGQAPSSTPPASPRLDLPLAASRSSVDRPDEGPDQTAAATAGVSGAAPAMQPSSQSRREPSVQRTIEMGAGQSSMVHAVPSDPPEAVAQGVYGRNPYARSHGDRIGQAASSVTTGRQGRSSLGAIQMNGPAARRPAPFFPFH